MKNNPLITEGFISFLLVVLLVLFLNPFQKIWMPTMGAVMVILAVIIVFIFYISFFWKEAARDEREDMHRYFAGRFGFISGSGLLLAGILVESLNHKLDNWLVITLVGMVLGKVIGSLYSQLKR